MAGGNGAGDSPKQFNSTYGVFVDSDGALFVTDFSNHRVMKWDRDASIGTLWAGGQCGEIDRGQICKPTVITFNKEGTMFVTAEQDEIGSVIRWKKGAVAGETLIVANSSLYGIALDMKEEYLYVGHHREHRVVKYAIDGQFDSVVAGGHGRGAGLNQLDYRRSIRESFFNRSLSVF